MSLNVRLPTVVPSGTSLARASPLRAKIKTTNHGIRLAIIDILRQSSAAPLLVVSRAERSARETTSRGAAHQFRGREEPHVKSDTAANREGRELRSRGALPSCRRGGSRNR